MLRVIAGILLWVIALMSMTNMKLPYKNNFQIGLAFSLLLLQVGVIILGLISIVAGLIELL